MLRSETNAVTAPGKLLVAGEYVVLFGAPAIACAVPYRARVWWGDDHDDPRAARPLAHATPRFPEAAAARDAAEAVLGAVTGALLVDVSELRHDDQKLGVGSSAAAAAAAAAAVFVRHGYDVSSRETRARVLDAALAGHSAVAPRGSGVDVAASVLGGSIRYVREPRAATSIAWPDGLEARVIWTGKAASTRVFLDKLAAFRAADEGAYQARMAALERETHAFAASFAEADAKGVISATERVTARLAELGEASGADIVEERLHQIAGLAQAHAGAAKPSGAGGGDVALGFFATTESADAFAEGCEDAGYLVLPLDPSLPEEGVAVGSGGK